MRVNKFNTSWQLIRVQARKIKEPSQKIAYVLSYLNKYPDIHTYTRVRNWMNMTQLWYPQVTRVIFKRQLEVLDKRKEDWLYTEEDTAPTRFNLFTKEQLLLIYKDLSKRKYGFQMKEIPKTHKEYMQGLEKYLRDNKYL